MLQDSRGQAISPQSPGIGEKGEKKKKIRKQSMQSAGGGWMMCLHWHQHGSIYSVQRLDFFVVAVVSPWVLTRWRIWCASPNSRMFHLAVTSSVYKSTCAEAHLFFFCQETVKPLSLSFKRLVNRIWWTKTLRSRKQKCGVRWWAAKEEDFSLKLTLCTDTHSLSANYQWVTAL